MLDSLEISHTGTFSDTVTRMNDYPLMVHKNGFLICLLNYTYGTNGMPVEKPNLVNKIDTAQIKKDLEKAKGFNPDAIIVFMHWGSEYQSLPNKFQKDISDFCFLYGAKVVIGSHPHVLQPIEWRKETDQLVAYSLGNFVSGQRKRYTDGGLMLKVELEKISQSDSSSDTRIHDSTYQLEWVYRTSGRNKKYFILPAHQFEEELTEENQVVNKSNLNLLLEDKKAFQLFLDDSRVLLNKYNLEVKEEVKR
jgi:Bacterial capsule synthesis protein PGA_cap